MFACVEAPYAPKTHSYTETNSFDSLFKDILMGFNV